VSVVIVVWCGDYTPWIQSFLTGRKQRVVVMGHKSLWEWIVKRAWAYCVFDLYQ